MPWTCQLTYHAMVKPAMKCVTREELCLPGRLVQGPRTLEKPLMELLSSSFLGSCQDAVCLNLDEARSEAHPVTPCPYQPALLLTQIENLLNVPFA